MVSHRHTAVSTAASASAAAYITTLMVDCDDKKGIILCHLKNDYDELMINY
jgi:hypothetical protein